MDLLTALRNALASLTAATGIAAFLKDSELSLPRDEMKLKLAELIAKIADAILCSIVSLLMQGLCFMPWRCNRWVYSEAYRRTAFTAL